MKRWLVAALPFVAALVLYLFLKTDEYSAGVYRSIGYFSRGVALIGCFFAAMQFDRGDYMRRAWLFLGTAYVFLLANAIIFGASSHTGSRGLSTTGILLSALLVLAANTSTATGAFMVAYAWKAAGLTFTVNRVLFWSVTAASVIIGLVVAGPGALRAIEALSGGNLEATNMLVSALGDIVALAVGGPILVTALTLRGGSLQWPWTMFVLGTAGWLAYDATGTAASMFSLDASQVRDFEAAARLFACVAFLSAGWLQAMVLRSGDATATTAKAA